MSNKQRTRRLLELQGFYNLADEHLTPVDIGLRTSPLICALVAATATILASAELLWAMLPFALWGGFTKGHPFDVIYNHGLRHIVNGPKLPAYGAPRRFACRFASVFIVATALSFQYGAQLAGYILGGSLVVAALVPVFTGFCIPSFIYRLVTGKLKSYWTAAA